MIAARRWFNAALDTDIAICNNTRVTKPLPHADAKPEVPPESAAPAAIASAERRLAMLGRLAELGMQLAETLAARAVAEPKDPEPRHDPARSFAQVSRAVRLTLALEARIEQDLAALRDGPDAAPSEPKWPQPPFDDPHGLKKRDHPSAHRNRIRDNVWDVVDHEVTDIYQAQELLGDLHERLTEGERYDSFLYRPLREGVEAICKDLGLTPDWSRWTDDGFPPETRTSRMDWASCWRPNPERIEARRLARAEALADPPPRTPAPP